MPSVFLSHRGGDDVRRARHVMKAFGLYVWDFEIDSDKTQFPAARIVEGFERCDVLVVLWSERSPERRWIQREIEFARTHGLRVLHLVPATCEHFARKRGEPAFDVSAERDWIQFLLRFDPVEKDDDFERAVHHHAKVVRWRSFALSLAFSMGVGLGWLGCFVDSSKSVVGTWKTWWNVLEASRMVGMPAHVAFVVGFFTTLLLMQITWSICNQAIASRRQPFAEQKLTWTVSSAIVLAICGVGVHFGAAGVQRFCPTESSDRWPVVGAHAIVGLLALLGVLLFWVDGRAEAKRMGVLD